MCLSAWTSSCNLVHHFIGIRGSCAPRRALRTTLHVVHHGEGVLLEQTGRPNHGAQGKVIIDREAREIQGLFVPIKNLVVQKMPLYLQSSAIARCIVLCLCVLRWHIIIDSLLLYPVCHHPAYLYGSLKVSQLFVADELHILRPCISDPTGVLAQSLCVCVSLSRVNKQTHRL